MVKCNKIRYNILKSSVKYFKLLPHILYTLRYTSYTDLHTQCLNKVMHYVLGNKISLCIFKLFKSSKNIHTNYEY